MVRNMGGKNASFPLEKHSEFRTIPKKVLPIFSPAICRQGKIPSFIDYQWTIITQTQTMRVGRKNGNFLSLHSVWDQAKLLLLIYDVGSHPANAFCYVLIHILYRIHVKSTCTLMLGVSNFYQIELNNPLDLLKIQYYYWTTVANMWLERLQLCHVSEVPLKSK